MAEIEKLNKNFQREQVLESEEMNAITQKIDEVIDNNFSHVDLGGFFTTDPDIESMQQNLLTKCREKGVYRVIVTDKSSSNFSAQILYVKVDYHYYKENKFLTAIFIMDMYEISTSVGTSDKHSGTMVYSILKENVELEDYLNGTIQWNIKR